jgi:2,3-bisphosphoglycerate-dependent phosphoglycerate mutase
MIDGNLVADQMCRFSAISQWNTIPSAAWHSQGLLALPHPVELHLMRHGESLTSARNLVTGSLDVDLTAVGREQAKLAASRLATCYDAAFCSTLCRSQETLRLALDAGRVRVSQDGFLIDKRLDERCLGELESQPARPISHYAAGNFFYAPRGGESYLSVLRRISSFLADLAEWIRCNHAKRVLIVSHMGPMRILSGILSEDTDPTVVLARRFNTADVVKYTRSHFACPKFHQI